MPDPTSPSAYRSVGLWGWNGTEWEVLTTDADGHLQVDVLTASDSFTPSPFDTVELSYTASNLTGVVYKLAGVVVSTLTLTYDVDNNLIKVVKS